MTGQKSTEFKYIASFAVALLSGLLAVWSLRYFMGGEIVLHIAFTNGIVIGLVWLVALKSPGWVSENKVMGVGIPLAGLYFMDVAVTFAESGMQVSGLAAYIVTSFALIFFTYKARSYEQVLFN